MKAVMIIHNIAIEADVDEALEASGVSCYSKFRNTHGRGQLSEPHLGTDVWPAVNTATLVVVEASVAKELMVNIRSLRATLGRQGVKAFMWEIEDIT